MALQGLLSLCVLILLTLQANQAFGSIRGVGTWTHRVNSICDFLETTQGYKCEENYVTNARGLTMKPMHAGLRKRVTTKDGYILNMQRIPEGRVANNCDIKKPPVLLQHGIMLDGMVWIMNQPEQNLPLILADNGFDVWIANTRGTRFSRQHTTLKPRQKEYWNWSWDELAAYDLPAFIEFIYNQTGQKVNYVGHSLGTLTAMASLSRRLLLDKMKSTVLLSPIAYMSHLKALLVDAAAKTFLAELGSIIGMAEFSLKAKGSQKFMKSVCSTPGVHCYDYLTVLTGKNCCLNDSTIDLALKNQPQSTSMKTLVHLAQIIRDKVIAKYDGSLLYNLKNYGSAKPPVYNLSNIPYDHPLFLSHGGHDGLSDVEDVLHLIDILNRSHDADKIKVQYVENYGHMDFVAAINAKDVVYNQVLSFFRAQQ